MLTVRDVEGGRHSSDAAFTTFLPLLRAVNARVARLARATGALVTVVTARDLKDVALRSTKLAGQFRAALGGAARRGDRLFPTLARPTVIANLRETIQLLVGRANLPLVSVHTHTSRASIRSMMD